MNRTSGLALVAVMAAGCSAMGCGNCAAPARNPVAIPLEIAIHPTASPQMDWQDAADLLRKTSLIVTSKDANEDTYCPVDLTLESFGSFEIGNGVIASQFDFDEVFQNGPGSNLSTGTTATGAADTPLSPRTRHVRVVSEVAWCGAEVASAAGCADGLRIVVARRNPIIEGILWAHEVGHTRGLGHREDSWLAIMHPEILNQHFQLNWLECSLYRR